MLSISITATDPDGIKLLTVMMNGTLGISITMAIQMSAGI